MRRPSRAPGPERPPVPPGGSGPAGSLRRRSSSVGWKIFSCRGGRRDRLRRTVGQGRAGVDRGGFAFKDLLDPPAQLAVPEVAVEVLAGAIGLARRGVLVAADPGRVDA